MFSKFFNPKPFSYGFLPEQDGHKVFFQEFGNPNGNPVINFHGGPGSKSKLGHATLFNLKKYRVVLFDQRGCGKSLPRGEIKNNTTNDLLEDALRLLKHLNIKDKVIVHGGSWGATLALLFSQRHPDLTKNLIVSKIFLSRKKDIEWMGQETKMFYPDIFEQMSEIVPKGKTVRSHYADLALSPDEKEQIQSTKLFGNYEHMIGNLNPKFDDEQPSADHMQNYKIYMHYDKQDYGVNDNEILENIHLIKDVPTLILHNRLDLLCPVEQAWLLHQNLNKSKLVIVPEMGHGGKLLRKMSIQEIEKFLNE